MKNKITSFFKKYEFTLPLIIFLLFLCASLPGITWGAPALWNPDEMVWRADMALQGYLIFDETEPDFNYPSLPKYVMYAIGLITYGMGKTSFAFIVMARAFSAFLGAVSGILIYYVARNIEVSKRMSLLAGIFYIVSGIAVENSRFAHNDLYLQLFSILCVFFTIKYQQTKFIRWLYFAFFSVGLAASSKFTGGSLILLPVTVFILTNWNLFLSHRLIFFKNLFFGGIFSFLGYTLGTPKALFAPVYYFSNVIAALKNYPQYGFNSGSPIGLLGQWAVFQDAVGIFAYYLFIFSLIWFVIRLGLWNLKRIPIDHKQRQAINILLLTILIFDLPFLVSINYIPRYFIPFIPVLSILAALAVEQIISFVKDIKIPFITTILIAVLTIGTLYSSLRLVSIALLFINDARIPATEYIATIRGYQKSIEYTLYPPYIEKRRFERAHNYPIYFVKYPNDVVPTGGRYEYNQGEQGLLERDTDYFVIDSYTYNRFYTDSICITNPIECSFFKKLLADEIESYQLIKEFTYQLPPYLPYVHVTAVNPEIKIYQSTR